MLIVLLVLVTPVHALDSDVDSGFPFTNKADFNPIVNITNQFFGGAFLEMSDQDGISPNWRFSRPVPLSSSPITIPIAMGDRGGGSLGAEYKRQVFVVSASF